MPHKSQQARQAYARTYRAAHRDQHNAYNREWRLTPKGRAYMERAKVRNRKYIKQLDAAAA